jgi:2-polyprenyl-3-methyl-5-hydroxy-6-metoxy-1,4-benzoquinol methylase
MASSSEASPFGDEYLDWKRWPSEGFGHYTRDDAKYFAAETGIVDGANLRVLEVGYGNGALLGWLKASGATVYGVEANPRLVAEATRFLGDERAFTGVDAEQLTRLAGTLTHIIAFDVLEHVPQQALGQMLASLGVLLAPTGRIIARFPNGDSPFGRIHQHGDPTHVTTIGRAKLDYFARRAGLAVSVLRSPALPHQAHGVVRGARRLMLQAARALIERVVGVLYFGGQRVPLEPNYVAVLTKAPAAAAP